MFDFDKERVFYYFNEISRIPRESGNEKAISDRIVSWAKEQGFEVVQDDVLNVIIKKPATAGYEDAEPVLLQAHMDMVCEKTAESTHDFDSDPIELAIDGDWLTSACGTSLGADNGIGVACAMAVLEDDSLIHPPLEVAFTVEEETTFNGADSISGELFSSKRMINLDHADDREIIAGSCGGTGAHFIMPVMWDEEIPKGYEAYKIKVTGLKGGHSGEDIHRGRGNAISLLFRVIEAVDIRLVSVDGGTNRLAIPREAEAVVLTQDGNELKQEVEQMKMAFRKELGEAAPELDVIVSPAEADVPMQDESLVKTAIAVKLFPNGIVNMNGELEGVVESSNNVGIIKVSPQTEELLITCEARGLYATTVDDIMTKIMFIADLLDAGVEFFGGYVSWEYVNESALRKSAVELYKRMFDEDMKVMAIHAGLECGMFAEKKPGMDIIAIGPTCQYFHSPHERVSISSVRKFYSFLIALLSELARI